MEVTLAWFVIGFSVLLYAIYYYLTRNFNYWKNHNVVGPKPIPYFGTFKDVVLSKIHMADYMKIIYDAYTNDTMVGMFDGTTPLLLIKDPEILKDVLIKNFETFPNRGIKIHFDIEPFAHNLFSMDCEFWRPVRLKLAPVFTSGKLKDMVHLIDKCSQNFTAYVDELVNKGEPINCRKLAVKFTTDIIGVCVFGLELNAIKDQDSEFLKIGHEILANNWTNKLRYISRTLPHCIAILLKPFAQNRQVYDFFYNTIIQTIEYRIKNNVRRNDFIDNLRDIKEQSEQAGEEKIPDIFYIAQAYLFFLAGFETPSTVMSSAMYELALNPGVQDNLRKEIVTTLNQNGGKLDYESIKNMKYLHKVFQETLRKYPAATMLRRVAEKDHTFAKNDISISKGTKIHIPVYAIHHDPNIYPEPEKFDPERFDENVVRSRPQMSYLAFGDGPRICIAQRFAHLQVKLGLCAAVKDFKFEVCEKTCKVFNKRKNTMLLDPIGGLYLRIKKA